MQSLYFHIPFCEKKCFYCSFIVTVSKKHIDEYVKSLTQEMLAHKGKEIDTIYFGGGTPSLMNNNQIDFLISSLRKNFKIQSNAEFTFEGNPEHIDLEKMKLLKALGVNRFSLGAQTFDNQKLIMLGRNHDKDSINRAYSYIREAGFNNVNIDLMYGMPKQDIKGIKSDLRKIKKLNCEHVSIYALSVEKNSLFYVKKVNLQGVDAQVKQYLTVKRLSRSACFPTGTG